MPKAFIRNFTSKHRTKRNDWELGITLAFVAGAINAGGFLAAGYYTSHMTGIVSSIADYIALNKIAAAFMAFMYLLSFIVGACVSSVIINSARGRNFSSEFAPALMLEAFLLVLFGIFATYLFNYEVIIINIIISLLCFIMGLQNAIITKISHAEIRTTHVTGLATDIGIELGRYLFSFTSKKHDIPLHPDKLKLHLSLLLSFLIGGLIGAIAFKSAGFLATIPFSLLLGIIASVPIIDDLKNRIKKV